MVAPASLRHLGVVEGVATELQREQALARGWAHDQGRLPGDPVPERDVAPAAR